MKTQETLMTNCPATGNAKPYPSHAAQWRKYHGATAWLFNAWTGHRRNAADVGSDPFGMAIHVEGEPFYAAPGSGVLVGGRMDCAGQITQGIAAQRGIGS